MRLYCVPGRPADARPALSPLRSARSGRVCGGGGCGTAAILWQSDGVCFSSSAGGPGLPGRGSGWAGPEAERRAPIGRAWGGVRPPRSHWPLSGAGPAGAVRQRRRAVLSHRRAWRACPRSRAAQTQPWAAAASSSGGWTRPPGRRMWRDFSRVTAASETSTWRGASASWWVRHLSLPHSLGARSRLRFMKLLQKKIINVPMKAHHVANQHLLVRWNVMAWIFVLVVQEFEDPRDADDAVYELDGKELCSERWGILFHGYTALGISVV